MLLDYAETYSNEIIRYKVINMVLHMDSDVVYLIITEARICYAEHFYLSDWPSPKPINPNPKRNGPIHTECKTFRNVVSSATDAEACRTFKNGKTYIGIRP